MPPHEHWYENELKFELHAHTGKQVLKDGLVVPFSRRLMFTQLTFLT